MLEELAVKNFIFIENAVLEFGPGFNVITGETGAGKSILLGALGAALGERTRGEWIMPGKSSLQVSATFTLTDNPEAREFLTTNGFSTDDNKVILRREATVDGKSKAYLN